MNGTSSLVEVRIVGLPLDAYREASEHNDELMREFALIRGGDTDVPKRLLELVNQLTERYGRLTGRQQAALEAAVARGEERIDLVYQLPADAKQAVVELGNLLDEADAYCREGTDLLTLATPRRALAFRRWFLDQFVRQIDGLEPTLWEEPEP